MSTTPSRADRDPLIERLLERSVRAVSGGGLHPLEIISAVEHACLEGVADGRLPNQVTVGFNPKDFAAFHDALTDLREEIARRLEQIERQYGYRAESNRLIACEPSEGTAAGSVRVAARFVDTAHRASQPPPQQATQAVRVQRNTTLILDDGRRVPLTHTPFTIGRGPGNDIVLASLAVSRHHARIIETPEGLVMEDLDSNNGISVNGLRSRRIVLEGGIQVRVGDIGVRVERSS